MTFEEIIARLREAQGNPEQLVLATVDNTLTAHEPRLREAFEAASIPHWFDARIISQLLSTDAEEASSLLERLAKFSMVEPFSARQGWNVHEATRLAIRRKLQSDAPDRFRNLSSIAAACWPGEDAVSRVETIYHLLASHPELGAEDLEKTYWKWDRSGKRPGYCCPPDRSFPAGYRT